MKKATCFLFLYCFSYCLYASGDTSKIYLTRSAFIHHQPTLVSVYRVKEKFWGGWSGFSFQAAGALQLKVDRKTFKQFAAGSLFAFETKGIVFIYNDSTNTYQALINTGKLLSLYVGELEKNIYKGVVVDELFYFSKNLGQAILVFDKENTDRQFNDSLLQQKLYALQKEIKKKGYNIGMHWRKFVQLQKLVKEYLPENERL